MFKIIATIILKWRNNLKKFLKSLGEINSSKTYYYNVSGKIDPRREKILWENFDKSFDLMNQGLKRMDEIFRNKR